MLAKELRDLSSSLRRVAMDKTWASVSLSVLICKMMLNEMTHLTLWAAEVLGFGFIIGR